MLPRNTPPFHTHLIDRECALTNVRTIWHVIHTVTYAVPALASQLGELPSSHMSQLCVETDLGIVHLSSPTLTPIQNVYEEYHRIGIGVGGTRVSNASQRSSYTIWETPGFSGDYPARSISGGIILASEVLTLLTGRSPLGLHGIDWIAGTESGLPILTGAIRQERKMPWDKKIVFDPASGYAPKAFRSSYREKSVAIDVNAYRSWNGQWLPEQIVVKSDMGHIASTTEYRLQDIQALTSPIVFQIPLGVDIYDLRPTRSGPPEYASPILPGETRSISYHVSYQWDGHLPTLQELEKKRNRLWWLAPALTK